MRIALVALALVACGPAASLDAGTDAPIAPTDAGPPIVEVFADLGITSEGIALGRTSDDAPVLFVGTMDDRIVRVAPDGAVTDFASIHAPLGIAVRTTGELVVCAKTSVADGEAPGIFEVALDGTITPLTIASPTGPYALTNFVAIASDGSLVFSDSAGNALYRADADGADVTLLSSAITYPNGLAFSPSGTTLYAASWATTTLYSLSFDASTGTYGEATPAIEDLRNVDGVITTSTGALVLVTSTTGLLTVDPAAPTADPIEIFPSRALALPANGAFGDAAFGATELYLTSLSRSSVFVVHTALMAP